MDLVWNIFSDYLFLLKFCFSFRIHSFVLMSNHYHMLISTPDQNLSVAMAYFHREISRQLNRHGNRINRTFAGRYRKCLIGNYHYFLNCYKYIYQNPIRSGQVDTAENYKFSTLNGKLGFNRLLVPVENDTLLFEGSLTENLTWINQVPQKDDLDSIRCALMKGKFKLREDLNTKKPNRLENSLLWLNVSRKFNRVP